MNSIMSNGERFIVWLNEQESRKGWSDYELARRAKVSHSMLSRARNDFIPPKWDALSKIAKAFDLPPEMAFNAAGLLPPASPQSTLDKRITHLVGMLPDERKADVLDYVEMLVKRSEERGKSVLKKTGPLTPQA